MRITKPSYFPYATPRLEAEVIGNAIHIGTGQLKAQAVRITGDGSVYGDESSDPKLVGKLARRLDSSIQRVREHFVEQGAHPSDVRLVIFRVDTEQGRSFAYGVWGVASDCYAHIDVIDNVGVPMGVIDEDETEAG